MSQPQLIPCSCFCCSQRKLSGGPFEKQSNVFIEEYYRAFPELEKFRKSVTDREQIFGELVSLVKDEQWYFERCNDLEQDVADRERLQLAERRKDLLHRAKALT